MRAQRARERGAADAGAARVEVEFNPALHYPTAITIGNGQMTLHILLAAIAGFPPFLDFTALSWASLAGHLLFALAGGAVVKARLG